MLLSIGVRSGLDASAVSAFSSSSWPLTRVLIVSSMFGFSYDLTWPFRRLNFYFYDIFCTSLVPALQRF